MAQPIFHDDLNFWESAVTIRPNRLYVYDRFTGTKESSRIHRPISNLSKGVVSDKAAVRITNYCNLLYHASPIKRVYSKATKKSYTFRINFITLTLPSKQIHDDKDIYRYCFKPFIRSITNNDNSFLYVWKAEVQANGNLHFHLSTSSFIHYNFIRMLWNNCVDKLGYVERAVVANPNSTDVHAVRNDKDFAIYMAKYLSKNDDTRRPVTIKTWDCSSWLKKQKTSDFLTESQFYELSTSGLESIRCTKQHPLRSDERIDVDCYLTKFTNAQKKLIPETMEIWNRAIDNLREKTLLHPKINFY